jgi:hypothetical protein
MSVQVAYRLQEELLEKIKELKIKEHRPSATNMVETLLYEAIMARIPSWKPKRGPAK